MQVRVKYSFDHLKEIFEGRVNCRGGNKRQSVEGQKLCVLTQRCSPGFKVLFEEGNPLFKFSAVLEMNRSLEVRKIINLYKKLPLNLP